MSKKVFILGLGHIGAALARQLHRLGYQVSGTSRDLQKFSASFLSNINVLAFQVGEELPKDLDSFDILISTLTPFEGTDDFHLHFFHQAAGNARLFFFSSTSVFANDQNEVDEDSLPLELSPRGSRLRKCEEALAQNFSRLSILRPGGLLSKERHPAKTLALKSGLVDGANPVNLIQEADVVDALVMIIEKNHFAPIVHMVCPNHPSKKEYYMRAAKSLGLPTPGYQQDSSVVINESDKKIVHSKKLLEWGFKFRSLDDF